MRGSRQGDSHGGLYLVDLETGAFEQRLDWNTSSIDFSGRGADRGLRGIVVSGRDVFIAASDELFVLDPEFRITASYRSPYLKHCHELWAHAGKLWLTSTGFDSLLRFDLEKRVFDFGVRFKRDAGRLNGETFDPQAPGGPASSNELHINSVYADDGGIYLGGRRVPALIRLTQSGIAAVAPLPLGTHNARPFRGGAIFNDTESDRVVWATAKGRVSLPLVRYPDADLTNTDFDESGLARQAFGRGLCPLSDTVIAVGSSPTTVSVQDLAKGRCLKSVNLTMDVRNAAHGLALWPF